MTAAPVRLVLAALVLLGCRSRPDSTVTLPPGQPSPASRRDEPPVPLDPEPLVEYPAALATQRIGGTVLLRIFVDSAGVVVADSTKLQESSGYPALDSAAIKAVPHLRYAPALRNGSPTAAVFLQPFNFRARPGGATSP